jgi:nitrate/TMAO reductase-like tetraheme cytochrome c subunit
MGGVRHTWRWLAIVAGSAALLLAPAGWLTTDALERDNDFCIACHISEGVSLHAELKRSFDARPAESLAAAHAAQELLCIDCHGGTGLLGRARVKALAARDALVWLVGPVEEPTEMHWPLLDADCRKCHERYAEESSQLGSPRFHELAVHNVELGVPCVDCHLSHEKSGNVGAQFLEPVSVRRRCALCHSQFEDMPLAAGRVGAICRELVP